MPVKATDIPGYYEVLPHFCSHEVANTARQPEDILRAALVESALVDKITSERMEKKVSQHVKGYGQWAVVLFGGAPFRSNDAISFVAGIAKVSYARCTGATAGGNHSPDRLA